MYDVCTEINNLRIFDVLDTLNIGYRKNGASTFLVRKDGTLDESFAVSETKNIAKDFGKSGIEGWPFDFVGQYVLGLSSADMRTTVWRATTIKFFVDKGFVTPPDSQKEFVKSLTNDELLHQFDDYKLGWYKQDISSLLLTRWVPSSFITKHQLLIGETFKDIWFYENYFCTEHQASKNEVGEWVNVEWDNPKTVPVFMFPCYNEKKELIGMKLRRKDWKTIRGKKSMAVGKTWLIYNKISTSRAIIVEGEMDYIILSILGYKDIVWNEGWVQSGRQMLKSLLFETSEIICLYDNDVAGNNGKLALSETMWRPIREIEYPIREDKQWRILSDVNDFYKVGYDTKAKWDKILGTSTVVGAGEEMKDSRFILLDKHLECYDTKYNKYQKTESVAALIGLTKKELFHSESIPKYEDLCYYAGWKKGYYNTLNESVIVKHGWEEEPIIHEHIEKLIDNISNYKKKNSHWIHKSILFKLTHLNNVYLPALVLYGFGWSGKGTFLNLLSCIFWTENTQIGLGQKDLESSFDSYSGNKLIVEFKEVSSGNRANDKKILDRIKSFVWESRISVNMKNKDVREIDNIARFHLSSNHAVPIQLDSKHSGNRRFSIIKTGNALDTKMAEDMNHKTFKDKKIIQQYVARLYDTYPDVPNMKSFTALDNDEKKQLEESCEGAANQFFERIERKYPHVYKMSNLQKNYFLDRYVTDIGESTFDPKYKQANFDLWLSHRYEKKAIKINGNTVRWYYINKTPFEMDNMAEWTHGEFRDEELRGMMDY